MPRRSGGAKLKRDVAWLALALAGVWIVFDSIAGLRVFIFEHHGIQFYCNRPYLIGLCLIIAVSTGLFTRYLAYRMRAP